MLAFFDLETTGLDPRAPDAAVLEVACVLTDDALVEIARTDMVVAPPVDLDWSRLDPVVQKMHEDSGLRALLAQIPPGVLQPAAVDGMLVEFLTAWKAQGAQLAGNTISFDRAWMAVHLPRAHAMLHYRNVDATTLNELARRFMPEIYAARPRGKAVAHRALADALESLATIRHYLPRLIDPHAQAEADAAEIRRLQEIIVHCSDVSARRAMVSGT